MHDLEEVIDVTTTTLPGASAQGEGLAVWREESLRLANGDIAGHRAAQA